jgi:hypothetical protein
MKMAIPTFAMIFFNFYVDILLATNIAQRVGEAVDPEIICRYWLSAWASAIDDRRQRYSNRIKDSRLAGCIIPYKDSQMWVESHMRALDRSETVYLDGFEAKHPRSLSLSGAVADALNKALRSPHANANPRPDAGVSQVAFMGAGLKVGFWAPREWSLPP